MSTPSAQKQAVLRIQELEKELAGLRVFFATDPACAGESSTPSNVEAPAHTQVVNTRQELLLCRAGDLQVVVPLSRIREVVPVARMMPLPDAAQGILGTLDLRGVPVMVHDLEQYLTGVPAGLERTNVILIVPLADALVGIKVTDAINVINSEVQSLAATSVEIRRSDIVLGVTVHEGRQVMVMDADAIGMRCTFEADA